MNRSEIVKRLMSEGLSSETLSKLNDKQLIILSNRMLGEQAGVEKTTMTVNKINTQTPAGKKLADDIINKRVPTKPGEIYKVTETEKGKGEKKSKVCTKCKTNPCECKLTKEELKGGQKKLDKNNNGKLDKEDFKLLRSKKETKEELKGKQHKLDANKNGKIDKEDFKLLKSKKSSKEEVKEGGEKWIQKAIHPSKKGSLKKSLGVKKDETIPAGKLKAAAKKGGKLGQRARLAMTLKKLKESVETEEWVESLIENQYHSMATKGEIMELISKKLNETEVISEIPDFMSFDSITGNKEKETETPTKVPTKDPGEKTPPSKNPSKTPFTPKHPRPAEDPGPKAGIRR